MVLPSVKRRVYRERSKPKLHPPLHLVAATLSVLSRLTGREDGSLLLLNHLNQLQQGLRLVVRRVAGVDIGVLHRL